MANHRDAARSFTPVSSVSFTLKAKCRDGSLCVVDVRERVGKPRLPHSTPSIPLSGGRALAAPASMRGTVLTAGTPAR